MLDYHFAVDRPGYLYLLALVPVVWWLSFRSLSGLGSRRRLAALGVRSAVLVLLILALAEAQLVRTSHRLTVIYLIDASLSIPPSQRREMIDYVNTSVRQQRKNDDRAAVIVFGRDAAVEVPPLDFDLEMAPRIESQIDPQYTNLADAMQLALALFPHDAARRIVILTDGNQNLGDALTQARSLTDRGVAIDVLPVRLRARSDVAVERISMPPDVKREQPFDLRVVLNRTRGTGSADVVRGKLRIVRKTGRREDTLAEQEVELRAGKRVFSIRDEIDQADFYTYEARFLPADSRADAIPQNNRATTFTHVRGRGQVLLIEDWAHPGEFDYLVERLRAEGLAVTVQSSDQLFTSLTELQRYDTVLLANVPRSSGDDAQNIVHFTDDQIRMLVDNTRELGCGLVLLGGPHSFGAGGWTNTELERAMPVDFQVKNPKVARVGALVLLMHASEMAQGNHWQKIVAREAIRALGGQDYCGLIHWQGTDTWLWGQVQGGVIRVGRARKQMLARLDFMTPGDMPQFEPAMKMAAAGFAGLQDAAVKHMIIISDGDPSPPDYGPLGAIRALRQQGVKITTVAVGTHGPAGSTPLQAIATATGGKYYVVKNPRALPRIYQREVQRIARPLVYEDPRGLVPEIRFPHEMLKGLSGAIRPITGFVLTTVKESPLVEVALSSPRPAGTANNTLLASWTYGLGKAVVWTTDTGQRWARSWPEWEHYDKLFTQIVRWSMRPTTEGGNFTVAIDLADGTAKIVVTALDKRDQYLNLLNLTGRAVGPDMTTHVIAFHQTAPGRYGGQFDAKTAGSYSIVIQPGFGHAPLLAGLAVPYSDEYRDHRTNLALLGSITSLAPAGGQPGRMLASPSPGAAATPLAADPFRHDLPEATASQDVWHLLVLIGTCAFYFDVLGRRVHLGMAWVATPAAALRDRLFGRRPAPKKTATMARLRQRKAQIDDQIEQQKASTRFAIDPETALDGDLLQQPAAGRDRGSAATDPDQPPALGPGEEAESYTERLLKAKKKVWQDRKGSS